jgi:hypothetical protein
MPAYATEIDFGKLWTQDDQDSERLLEKALQSGLDKRTALSSGVLAKIKKGKTIYGPVTRWMEEEGYPVALTAQLGTSTLTVTGNLQGAAVTEASIRRALRVGTILERPSDGQQVRVDAVTGVADGSSPWTVTVSAHGGGALSDDTGPVTYDIISELWDEFRDADETRMLERKFREVGYQQRAETFEIGDLRAKTKYEIVGNEYEHQTQALIDKMHRQMSVDVVRMKPKVDVSGNPTFGNKVAESSMCGLLAWAAVTQHEAANENVYKNLANTELKKSHLNDVIRRLWLDEFADYNTGDWWLLCDPLLADYLHDMDMSYRRKTDDSKDIGWTVDTFRSKIGKHFPILTDRYMRPGTLAAVNFDAFTYGYFGGQMDKKELATQGTYRRWLFSYVTYGLVARDPRANIGIIYGVKTRTA